MIPMGPDLAGMRDQFGQLLVPFLQRLQKSGVVYSTDPEKMNTFALMRAREQFMAWPEGRKATLDIGSIFGDLSVLGTLVHGYGMLHQHGIGPLYAHLKAYMEDTADRSRSKQELLRNTNFQAIMRDLDQRVCLHARMIVRATPLLTRPATAGATLPRDPAPATAPRPPTCLS